MASENIWIADKGPSKAPMKPKQTPTDKGLLNGDRPRAPVLSTISKCSLKHAHECFMHTHDGKTRATCKKLQIKASGNCRNCSACSQAKIQTTPIQTGRTNPTPVASQDP